MNGNFEPDQFLVEEIFGGIQLTFCNDNFEVIERSVYFGTKAAMILDGIIKFASRPSYQSLVRVSKDDINQCKEQP